MSVSPISPLSPPPLYRIDECPELMVDSYIADQDDKLVFLSFWGRDTAVQQFLARLTLGGRDEGMDHFHLVRGTQTLPAFVDEDHLEKHLTRCYRQTLFGSLVHAWLFDERAVKPDKANATALVFLPRDSAHRIERLWALAKDTCPLPLLDHWRDPVLEFLTARAMLEPLPTAIGPLEGHWLRMDIPSLTEALGNFIRAGILTAEPQAPSEPLRLAA
jgi:hypothetical protein